MSDPTNIVDLGAARTSDLAVLQAKAADLKIELHNKFRELCIILDKMSGAGICVDFTFAKPPGQSWQVTSKVYKEL